MAVQEVAAIIELQSGWVAMMSPWSEPVERDRDQRERAWPIAIALSSALPLGTAFVELRPASIGRDRSAWQHHIGKLHAAACAVGAAWGGATACASTSGLG